MVTSITLVNRTRATFRSAEYGFLGVEVYTRVQTPRFWGQLFNAGLDVFQAGGFRPIRTSWLKVGTHLPLRDFLCVEQPTYDQAPVGAQNSTTFAVATARITCFRQAHVRFGVTEGTSGPYPRPDPLCKRVVAHGQKSTTRETSLSYMNWDFGCNWVSTNVPWRRGAAYSGCMRTVSRYTSGICATRSASSRE